MLRRRRYQAPARGEDGEKESRGGHKVEQAVDTEAQHQVRADKRANHRAKPTHEDELAAHSNHPVGRHSVVRVGDADRVER